jgi:hypothetical protein
MKEWRCSMSAPYVQLPKRKHDSPLEGSVVEKSVLDKTVSNWQENPDETTSTSEFVGFLKIKRKSSWDRGAWIIAVLATILALAGGILKLWR